MKASSFTPRGLRVAGAAGTLVLAASLAACSSSSDRATGSDLGKTDSSAPFYNQVPAQYRKGISVALQVNAPPLSMAGSDGKPTGEDPELFAELSKQLGVPINIKPTTFENELLGLDQGKYDFIAQTNITSDREQKYDQLSQFKDGYALVGLKGGTTIPNSLSGLCGATIAAQSGDGGTDYLVEKSKQCTSNGDKAIKLVQLKSIPEEYVTVASGRAQAAMAPISTLSYFLASKDKQLGKSWQFTGPRMLPVLAGYSFPKGSKLITAVQSGIEALMKDGTYKAILDKNGLSENVATSALINPTPPVAK